MIPSPTSPVPAETAKPSTLAKRRGRKAASAPYTFPDVGSPAWHEIYRCLRPMDAGNAFFTGLFSFIETPPVYIACPKESECAE